jgi:hypothetical protein
VARKRKPSGSLKKGPFTTADLAAALIAAGAKRRSGGGHQDVYEHPSGWKVPVSSAWTGLRKGCPILKGIARTTGLSDTELLLLLNGITPRGR